MQCIAVATLGVMYGLRVQMALQGSCSRRLCAGTRLGVLPGLRTLRICQVSTSGDAGLDQALSQLNRHIPGV